MGAEAIVLIVTTQGTAYERGRQYGEQLGQEMRRRAPASPLHPLAAGDTGGAAGGDGNALAGRMLRYLDRHEPALVDEMRGLAAGAGVSFDAVFHLNVASPVQYIQDFPADRAGGARAAHQTSPAESDGCTNVAFATTERGPLLGKTNDGGAPAAPEHQPSTWVLQHAFPAAGPAFFLLGPVGALAGVAGMNASGFTVGQSAAQVVPGQDGSGVPNNLILRALLERCATVEDALKLLFTRDLAGKGLNLMLLDEGGTVRVAEKSAGRLGVRTPDDRGTLYFSNHCHTPGLRELPPRHDRDNSLRRWSFLQDHFASDGRDRESDHSWEHMRTVISSHGRSDQSSAMGVASLSPSSAAASGALCQHGPDMFTSLGLLIAPRERTLWTADGPPCVTPFVERRLGVASTPLTHP